MAEITRKRKGELVRGIFSILLENPDGLAAKDVLARLESVVPPTPFEQSTYPDKPNVCRYEKIVRFSTIGPVKAGWLVKEKGRWSLTDVGIAAYNTLTDPASLMLEADRLYRQWESDQPPPEEQEEEETTTTVEEAEESAWSEVEEYLSEMNPYDFQNLVAGLLRGMGYHVRGLRRLVPTRE